MGTDLYRVGDTETRLRSVVHSLGLIIGAFATGILLALVAFQFAAFAGVRAESATSIPVWLNVLTTVLQFVGFLLVGLWYLRWRESDEPLFEFGTPSLRDLGWVLLGFIGLVVALNIIGAIVAQLGVDSATNAVVEQGNQNPEFFLYLIPIAFLFNAPAEELLFRGLIQGLFRQAYGVVPGVLIASTLFGAVHYLALTGGGSKLVYLFVAAALGLILGFAYEKTENLVVPILIHGLYNALQFYIAYLSATGQIQLPG